MRIFAVSNKVNMGSDNLLQKIKLPTIMNLLSQNYWDKLLKTRTVLS